MKFKLKDFIGKKIALMPFGTNASKSTKTIIALLKEIRLDDAYFEIENEIKCFFISPNIEIVFNHDKSGGYVPFPAKKSDFDICQEKYELAYKLMCRFHYLTDWQGLSYESLQKINLIVDEDDK